MWIFAIRAIKKDLKEIFLGTFSILVGLVACLAVFTFPSYYLFGNHIVALFIFWFMIVPYVTVFISKKRSKRKSPLVEIIAGMVLFFGMVTFMIFNYYGTEYFQLVVISACFNLVLVPVYILSKSLRRRIFK